MSIACAPFALSPPSFVVVVVPSYSCSSMDAFYSSAPPPTSNLVSFLILRPCMGQSRGERELPKGKLPVVDGTPETAERVLVGMKKRRRS